VPGSRVASEGANVVRKLAETQQPPGTHFSSLVRDRDSARTSFPQIVARNFDSWTHVLRLFPQTKGFLPLPEARRSKKVYTFPLQVWQGPAVLGCPHLPRLCFP
jgi:hypothetical protein